MRGVLNRTDEGSADARGSERPMDSAVQTALILRRGDRLRIAKQNETEMAFWVNKRDICLPFRFL